MGHFPNLGPNFPTSRDRKEISLKIGAIGRIAERIAANELEFRGFKVTDLNKGGPSENVDLLAARDGRVVQIQVKGASQNKPNGWEDWWVGFGHCNAEIIAKQQLMFNRVADSFYKAEVVALVAVRTPSEFCCVILPVAEAERAAQISIDIYYRDPPRKPHYVSAYLDRIPSTRTPAKQPLFEEQLKILKLYKDNWNI